MKKILVPIDFSKHSEYALQVAAQIARKQDAEIIALHMLGMSASLINKPEAGGGNEAIFYMKLAEKNFAEFLDKPYLEGLNVTDAVKSYKVFSELNDSAEEYGADLIIMGSHGSSGMSEMFVGSNTEKVVRSSEVPVLVIKENDANFKMDKVIFACDFNDESIRPFQRAMRFFGYFNSEVNVIHINLPFERFNSSAEMRKKAELFFEKAGIKARDQVNEIIYYSDYTIEKGIFNYCKGKDIDVIALPTRGKKGLAHFFLGSIGEDVVNHATLPVITFKV